MKVRGVELALHPSGDYVSDAIRLSGDFYEAAILDELARRLAERRPGIIVDAGAMIGNHAAYLAAFAPHTSIEAFEPIPDNLDLLIRNVAPWPEVHVYPSALSSRAGRVTLIVDRHNRGHSRIDGRGTFVVDAVALDDRALAEVSLLKIDVEGHERDVLAGARGMIEDYHPLILVEDWPGTIAGAMPAGYDLVADWSTEHQTYLYEWSGE